MKLSQEQIRELERQAKGWQEGTESLCDFEDSDAEPRRNESVAISIRMPREQLRVLREFAKRQGVGYQVLMKRWLDDRIQLEFAQLKEKAERGRVWDFPRPEATGRMELASEDISEAAISPKKPVIQLEMPELVNRAASFSGGLNLKLNEEPC